MSNTFMLVGATRPQYAPEPLDVGWLLRADLTMPDEKKESIFTTGPLDAGGSSRLYADSLVMIYVTLKFI